MNKNQNIFSDDDDFMEPLPVAYQSKFAVRINNQLKTAQPDNDYTFVEGGIRLSVTADMKFQNLDSLTDIIFDWARKEHMILIRSKFEANKRLYLTCKFSDRFLQQEPKDDAKRQGQTWKTEYKFIIRMSFKSEGNYWSVLKPSNADEHRHDHPCTKKFNRVVPQGKANLLECKNIKKMVEMVHKNTSIPEIRKNIGTFEGAPILEYQDIANFANEIKESATPNSKIEDAKVLINKMESSGYHVKYQVSQSKDELSKNGRFFEKEIKEEAIKLVEKMIHAKDQNHFDNLVMKYISLTHNSENVSDFHPDADMPECNKALSYLEKNWLSMKQKWAFHLTKKLAHFNCLSTQRAESGHRALKVGLSRRLDLISAFENIDAYCSSLKQKLALLEQKETQKQDLLMRRNNRLNRVRGKVSRAALIAAHSACIAVESGEVARENGDEDDDCSCSAKQNFLLPCVHTVLSLEGSPFDLQDFHHRWHLEDVEDVMTCSVPSVDLVGSNEWQQFILKLESRFRCYDNSPENSNSFLTYMQKAMNEYDSKLKEPNTLVTESEENIVLPSSQEVKKIGRPAKEPCYSPWLRYKSKSKTRSEQIQSKITTGKYLYDFEKKDDDDEEAERKEVVENKEEKIGKVKEERVANRTLKFSENGKKFFSFITANKLDLVKDIVSQEDSSSKKRKRATADTFLSIFEDLKEKSRAKKAMVKQEKDHRFASQISVEIPANAFTGIVDVKPDGFCGFRALAAQIFDDENEFLEVKYAMRDQLLSNYDTYLKAFGQMYDLEACKRIICFGIEEKVGSKKTSMDANTLVENRFWFLAPECAQIAACTFGVPVAVYDSDNGNLTFLSVLNRFNSANFKTGPKPLPLMMHFVNKNHWITLKTKRSIKMTWPTEINLEVVMSYSKNHFFGFCQGNKSGFILSPLNVRRGKKKTGYIKLRVKGSEGICKRNVSFVV
ncbi:hypothetical protein EDC96DRAFT_568527 [Choanephora cucurbitarum]|nr:hypothetical protein EDC96DRAFT_568527 [Choanephora cucurbitarum]